MVARTMSVVTNHAAAVFQSSVIRGATEIAAAAGLELRVIESAPGRPEEQVTAAAAATDCTLVLMNMLSDAALARLQATRQPLTLVSHAGTNLELPTVMHDNRQGIGQLMSHLIVDCARRQPVFIQGEQAQLDAQEREQAFREELMRHSLSVPERHFIPGGFEPHLATASLTEFLTTTSDFDSVVASDYLMGLAALQVLRATGREVPGDVSVVAFGDSSAAEAAGLTTVSADVVELGRRGARQLVAQLGGQNPGVMIRGRTLLSTQLQIRASSLGPR
jgi:LacI family transcriptional regulator